MAARLRWRPAHGRRDDAGTSLVETLVTMVMMSVLLALLGTAVLGLFRGVRKQAGVVDAQQATRTAFLVLDKQIRYAEAVSTPATVSGDQWIEWQLPDPSIPLAQSATQSRCYQWRASPAAGTLRYRTWVVPTSGVVPTPAWVPVATGLVSTGQAVFTVSPSGLAAAPFSLPATSVAPAHQRVGVSLTVSHNSPAGRAAMSTVFTALNSGPALSSVCTQVARS